MMSVQAFAEDYISVWEDGGSRGAARILSLDPADPGNWTGGACGRGVCCGSQHGVTPQALAAWRGCPVADVTEAMMRAVTLADAGAIAVDAYYRRPGLAALAWNPVTASVMDFGWNTGPRNAVTRLQRLIGATPDGAIGPATSRDYAAWIAGRGIAAAATAWGAARDDYYRQLAASRPTMQKYLNGWTRRTAWYLPGTTWWGRFDAAPAG